MMVEELCLNRPIYRKLNKIGTVNEDIFDFYTDSSSNIKQEIKFTIKVVG